MVPSGGGGGGVPTSARKSCRGASLEVAGAAARRVAAARTGHRTMGDSRRNYARATSAKVRIFKRFMLSGQFRDTLCLRHQTRTGGNFKAFMPMDPATTDRHPDDDMTDNALLAHLANRRSPPIAALGGEVPDDDIRTMLSLASRVPDHGMLTPFRFILFRGDARRRGRQAAGEAARRAGRPACRRQRARRKKSAFRGRRLSSASSLCRRTTVRSRSPNGSSSCAPARWR